MSALRQEYIPTGPINPPRPGDPAAAQRELDRMCRDRGIELRIVWGPEENQTILDGRVYKRYRLIPGFLQIKRGYKIVRDGQVVGYEHFPSGIVTGDPNGLRQPDTDYVQPAMERWIIEQRLHDGWARKQWANARYALVDTVVQFRCQRCDYEWLPDRGETECRKCGSCAIEATQVGGRMSDVLGEFPEEGLWKCFLIVGAHDADRSCCDFFESQLKVCIGRSARMPDHTDLEIVEQALAHRDKWEVLHNIEEPPTAREIDIAARQYEAQLLQQGEDAWAEITKEVGEDLTPLFSALDNPKVDVGAVGWTPPATLKRLVAKNKILTP